MAEWASRLKETNIKNLVPQSVITLRETLLAMEKRIKLFV